MTCVYEGHERAFCPIILGHSKADEKVLIYQFDGRTSKGALLRPEWKCFFVFKMAGVKISEGEWRAGDLHRQAQSCVENGPRRKSVKPVQPSTQALIIARALLQARPRLLLHRVAVLMP